MKVKLNQYNEIIGKDEESGIDLPVTEPLEIKDPKGHRTWPRYMDNNGVIIENAIRELAVTTPNSTEIVGCYAQSQFDIDRDFGSGQWVAPNGNIVHDIDFAYRGQEKDEFGNYLYELVNEVVTPKTTATDAKLASWKTKLHTDIDRKTKDIISNTGYTTAAAPCNGVIMSSSDIHRAKLEAAHNNRNDPAIPYPFLWASKDNTIMVSIANADDIHAMYLACFLGLVMSAEQAGNAQKEIVNAMTTEAELAGYTDPR